MTTVGKYKLMIQAEAIFSKGVEIEAESYADAVEKAYEIYQNADVCNDWVCDHMDCEVESIYD